LANISTYLQKILDAIYGEEVRGSIHDALAAMNAESSNAMSFAATAKDSAQAYAAEAKKHETGAGQKASEAAAFANAAAASEGNVKASETVASQNASEAAAAAAEAKASETNAAASASAAAQNAASAADSAASAQQYSGKPPKPQDGSWWIWNDGTSQYEDTGIGCELAGPPGVSIQDIVLTSGDHTPGTSDVYTIKLTDGTSKPVSVYNGRNGTGVGDVLGIAFDLVLPASGWADGAISVSDSRLLASAKYKYFIGAEAVSVEEYRNCGVQPTDVTTDGVITFTGKKAPAASLTVSVIRLELGANGA